MTVGITENNRIDAVRSETADTKTTAVEKVTIILVIAPVKMIPIGPIIIGRNVQFAEEKDI